MTQTSNIVVIDYKGGNLASAARALSEAANNLGQSISIHITNDPQKILSADRIVLPGQGAFTDCMHGLKTIPYLLEALETSTARGTPFLGICVGMQLMAERGLEHQVTQGLSWISGEITRIATSTLPLPQMGWNELEFEPNIHPLLEGILPNAHAYFVHSYALSQANPKDIIATTHYGDMIPAIVARGNRAGTQFHVEKSQRIGLRILANFLTWTPSFSPF